MKQRETKYLDGDFTVLEEVPASASEIVALIGEEEVVDQAVGNVYYRNKYPRVYSAVSEALVKEHTFPKVKVGEKTKKDGTKTDVSESDMDHIRAFKYGRKAEDGTIPTPAPAENTTTLQALFELHGQNEPFYVKPAESGLPGGKVSQGALDTANQYFAMGPETVEKVATKIEGKVPGLKVARDAANEITVDALARAIQQLNIKLARDAAAAAKAELSAAVT